MKMNPEDENNLETILPDSLRTLKLAQDPDYPRRHGWGVHEKVEQYLKKTERLTIRDLKEVLYTVW